MNGKYTLKHIGVGSAFKMGAAVGGILSAIILVPLGLLTAIGVVGSDDTSLIAAGATMGQLTMFCGPVVYALIYGVLTALNALVFNVIARIVGGLEIHLERSSSFAPLDVEGVVKNLTEFHRAANAVESAHSAQGEGKSSSPPSVGDVW